MGGRIKTPLYIVLFFGCSIIAAAQPRLDRRTLPTPSKSFVLGIADTVGVKVGAAGRNVFWDFTQLRRRVGVDSTRIQYLTPAETPPQAAALFPTAEVAVLRDQRYEFFRTEGTMFRSLGEWAPTSSLISGTANPYDTRPVELTHGGQHTDDFNAIITSPTAPLVQQRSGTVSFTYDGFGRLRLPNGEVDSVTRTRTITRVADTARFTEPVVRLVIRTTDVESYRWMHIASDVPWLIATFTTSRVTANGKPVSSITTREFLFRDTVNSTTGIDEVLALDDTYTLHPNPARSNEQVVVRRIDTEVVGATLVNVQGITHDVVVTRADKVSSTVRLDNVAAGSYVLVLQTATGLEHYRLVVMP